MVDTVSGERDSSIEDKKSACLQGAFIVEWEAGNYM